MAQESPLQPSVQPADERAVGAGTDSGGAFGPLSGAERRRLGRFAGVLMIVGGLFSLPAGSASSSTEASPRADRVSED